MAYRESDEVGLARRRALADALATEADLEVRERIGEELAALDRGRRAEAKRRLPMIASARIASPCHEVFEAMTGEGPVRTCARCDQEVFDAARMTLVEVEILIASRRTSPCMRLTKRRDGALMFADCEVGASGIRAKRTGLVVAAAALVLGASALLHATSPGSAQHRGAERSLGPRPSGGVHYLHETPTSRAPETYQGLGTLSVVPIGRAGS